jgi:hypothetical protein
MASADSGVWIALITGASTLAGVLLTSLSTLGGVLLSQRSQERNTLRTLEHQRQIERDRDAQQLRDRKHAKVSAR